MCIRDRGTCLDAEPVPRARGRTVDDGGLGGDNNAPGRGGSSVLVCVKRAVPPRPRAARRSSTVPFRAFCHAPPKASGEAPAWSAAPNVRTHARAAWRGVARCHSAPTARPVKLTLRSWACANVRRGAGARPVLDSNQVPVLRAAVSRGGRCGDGHSQGYRRDGGLRHLVRVRSWPSRSRPSLATGPARVAWGWRPVRMRWLRATRLSPRLESVADCSGAGAGACNDATAPSCAAALASRHALPPPLD